MLFVIKPFYFCGNFRHSPRPGGGGYIPRPRYQATGPGCTPKSIKEPPRNEPGRQLHLFFLTQSIKIKRGNKINANNTILHRLILWYSDKFIKCPHNNIRRRTTGHGCKLFLYTLFRIGYNIAAIPVYLFRPFRGILFIVYNPL